MRKLFETSPAIDFKGIMMLNEIYQSFNDLFFSYRAASIAASAGGADSKRPRALIWPEWNEKDVNDEKWVSLMQLQVMW